MGICIWSQKVRSLTHHAVLVSGSRDIYPGHPNAPALQDAWRFPIRRGIPSSLYIRLPSCPDAPLCRALKCLCASSCKGLPFLRSPPPGLPVFFAMPTGRCRAKVSLRGLRPNRAGTSCKQSFYSFAAKTLYTIL